MIDSPVINVRVRELNQLFDTMDPSPFHEQDLAPSAAEYIVDSAKELHVKVAPTVRIHLDNPAPDLDASATERAMRAHFSRRATQLRRTVRDLLRDGVVSLAIGLAWWPIVRERRLHRLARQTVTIIAPSSVPAAASRGGLEGIPPKSR